MVSGDRLQRRLELRTRYRLLVTTWECSKGLIDQSLCSTIDGISSQVESSGNCRLERFLGLWEGFWSPGRSTRATNVNGSMIFQSSEARVRETSVKANCIERPPIPPRRGWILATTAKFPIILWPISSDMIHSCEVRFRNITFTLLTFRSDLQRRGGCFDWTYSILDKWIFEDSSSFSFLDIAAKELLRSLVESKIFEKADSENRILIGLRTAPMCIFHTSVSSGA